MIKSLYYFLSILLFSSSICLNIHAQNNPSPWSTTVFLGAVAPIGDFSATSGTQAGFANFGYSGMFEISRSMNNYITWTTSISLAINSFNNDEMKSQVAPVNISSENYHAIWCMTGIRLESFTTPESKIYGLGQIGFLSINSPIITASFNNQVTIKQPIGSNPVFAFGLGAGLIFNNFNVGLRYWSGNPVHKEYQGSSLVSIKQNVSVFQVVVGYNI